MNTAERRLLEYEANRIDVVQQYKSIEGESKKKVLKEMDRLAQRGWRIHSFGWSNGFQGGWYALMVLDITL